MGRTAKSETNRIGQAWREVPKREVQDGCTVIIGYDHFKCVEPGCGAVVEIIHDEWAACINCGRIYNDFVAEQAHAARLALNREIAWSRFVKQVKEP